MAKTKPVYVERKKPSPETLEILRMLAKQIFVADRDGLDLDGLALLPEMDRIPKKLLRQWCTEDDWINARARMLRDLRRDMEDVARRAMVSTQRKQLLDTYEIHEAAMDMLRDEMLQPKSYESVASVAFKAQEVAAAIAQRLGEDVARQVTGPDGDDERADNMLPGEVAEMVSRNLTEGEAMAAAHAVLTKRREALLESMAGQAGDRTPPVQMAAPAHPDALTVAAAPITQPPPAPQIPTGPLILTQEAKPTGKP